MGQWMLDTNPSYEKNYQNFSTQIDIFTISMLPFENVNIKP